MIFRNELTENEKVKMFIESAIEDDNSCFIFKSYYDEEANELILNNLYYNENGIIHEENISQKDLGIKMRKNQNKPRYVMITGKTNHGGRMKVSMNGIRINQNNKSDYISIYDNGNEIDISGNINNIHMDKKEYKLYEDLYRRNEDLIQFCNNHHEYDAVIDKAFIMDEKLRRDGYIVIRNRKDGSFEVYDNNNNLIRSGGIKEEF